MIGMNWKKSLVVAGAVLAVAAAVPAFTQAHTQYVSPPSVAMTTTPDVVMPVKKAATKKVTGKKLTHHKLSKKTPVKHTKHKLTKKHTKLSTKTRAV